MAARVTEADKRLVVLRAYGKNGSASPEAISALIEEAVKELEDATKPEHEAGSPKHPRGEFPVRQFTIHQNRVAVSASTENYC